MIGRSKGTFRFIPSLVLGQEAATTARKSTRMSALLYESKDSKHFCFRRLDAFGRVVAAVRAETGRTRVEEVLRSLRCGGGSVEVSRVCPPVSLQCYHACEEAGKTGG